jgi:NAD-dependent dihydropyrimidine dehydrogenase PreA subunit
MQLTIEAELCKGCGICKRNCPVDAIVGDIKQPHVIDLEKCIKCGTCINKCPFHAIKN